MELTSRPAFTRSLRIASDLSAFAGSGGLSSSAGTFHLETTGVPHRKCKAFFPSGRNQVRHFGCDPSSCLVCSKLSEVTALINLFMARQGFYDVNLCLERLKTTVCRKLSEFAQKTSAKPCSLSVKPS